MRIVVVPEHLRSVSQEWQRNADQLRSLVSRLSSAVNSLDWETRQRSGIDWRWDQCRTQANALADHGAGLSRMMSTKADRFLEADNSGASSLGAALRPFKLDQQGGALLDRMRSVLAFPKDYVARLLSLGSTLGRAPTAIMASIGGLSGLVLVRASGTQDLQPVAPAWQDRVSKAAQHAVSASPISSVSAPTPLLVDTKSPSNPFLARYHGECTYWAWERYHQVTGQSAPFTGNGGQWADEAASYPGWKVGTQPKVGAFVVIPPYKYQGGDAVGHVAYVESVAPDGTFTVSEMNRLGQGDGPDLTPGYPQSYLFYRGTSDEEKKRVLGSIKFVYRES